jgi:hypothetical protein
VEVIICLYDRETFGIFEKELNDMDV